MHPRTLELTVAAGIVVLLGGVFVSGGNAQQAGAIKTVPMLVESLYHTQNRPPPASWYIVTRQPGLGQMVTRRELSPQATRPDSIAFFGGDVGAPKGEGFVWLASRDRAQAPDEFNKLPPGLVFALKHSKNQPSVRFLERYDPFTGPNKLPGFTKRFGGDRGANNKEGFYWYESTWKGVQSDAEMLILDRLPVGTVAGLRHTENNKDKSSSYGNAGTGRFFWGHCGCSIGEPYICDASDPNRSAPAGWVRVVGGDRGASSGQGFVWFEKVSKPTITGGPCFRRLKIKNERLKAPTQ